MSSRDKDTIRDLNDAFRKAPEIPGNRWLMTRGVIDRGEDFAIRAVAYVQMFKDFTPDNDPYGEHDFGSFMLDHQKVYWKIDYYDLALEHGSENPADATITRRVLTIMLASEY